MTRARHAREALISAIETIVVPLDKEVAQAALCSTKDYEGLTIKERLPKLPNMSLSSFKYHRSKAFTVIVRYLTRAPASEPKQAVEPFSPRRHDLKDNELLLREIVHYVLLTLRLHYAGLTALFCQDLEAFLSSQGILDIQLAKPFFNDQISGYIFSCYIQLLYWPHRANLDRELNARGGPSWLGVDTLLDRLGDLTPLGPQTLPEDATLEMPSYTPEEKQRRRLRLAERAYKTHWKPWYSTNCRLASTSPESALVTIAATSGALASLLIGRNKLRAGPLHKQARLAAQKTLSGYYSKIDDTAPLAGNLSLRQRAEAYFDIQSVLLTKQGTLWHSEYRKSNIG